MSKKTLQDIKNLLPQWEKLQNNKSELTAGVFITFQTILISSILEMFNDFTSDNKKLKAGPGIHIDETPNDFIISSFLSPITFKGKVDSEADLPSTSNKFDSYVVQDINTLFIFDGSKWINSGKIASSNPLTADQLAVVNGEVFTTAFKNKLDLVPADTTAEINKKQDTLSTDQLAVISAKPYTQAEKDKVSHLPADTTVELGKKQDTLSTDQLAVLGGKIYTQAEKAKVNELPDNTKEKISEIYERFTLAITTNNRFHILEEAIEAQMVYEDISFRNLTAGTYDVIPKVNWTTPNAGWIYNHDHRFSITIDDTGVGTINFGKIGLIETKYNNYNFFMESSTDMTLTTSATDIKLNVGTLTCKYQVGLEAAQVEPTGEIDGITLTLFGPEIVIIDFPLRKTSTGDIVTTTAKFADRELKKFENPANNGKYLGINNAKVSLLDSPTGTGSTATAVTGLIDLRTEDTLTKQVTKLFTGSVGDWVIGNDILFEYYGSKIFSFVITSKSNTEIHLVGFSAIRDWSGVTVKSDTTTRVSPSMTNLKVAPSSLEDQVIVKSELTPIKTELDNKIPKLIFNDADKKPLQDGGGFVWQPDSGNLGLEEVTIDGKTFHKLLVLGTINDSSGAHAKGLYLPDQEYTRWEILKYLELYRVKKIKIFGSYPDWNNRINPESGDMSLVEGTTDADDRLIIKAADGDKKFLNEEQTTSLTSANDWEEVNTATAMTFNVGTGTGTGTTTDAFEDAGTLDTNTQRADFITNAKVNQRYVFTHNGIPISGIVTHKDTLKVNVLGSQIITGSSGLPSIDFVYVNITENGINITETKINAGGYKQNYSKLPKDAVGNELITKDTTEEMIREYDLKTETRLWLTLEDTNFHTSFDSNQPKSISLIHNEKIITSQHPDGHPIEDDMNVMYRNGLGQIITIHYTKDPFVEGNVLHDDNGQWLSDRKNVRQTIFDTNTGHIIGSFLPKVEYITASSSWQVHFVDPRDMNGVPKDFAGNINITQMTLVGNEILGQEQSFTLLASDLIDENTWETSGKSHHVSASLVKGGHVIISNLGSAKSNINLGIYANDNQQYTNITKHMNYIAPGRPIYSVAFRHGADNTAGWLREMLFKYELVNKTDNNAAVSNWDDVDMTKLKITFVKARKADAVGQLTTSWDVQVRGLDPKEVI